MNGLSKKLLLCFCLCFCFTAVDAQYRIDQWTADDGLPQNSVYGIVQTRDGYLWLATLDGLARFDGVRFTVFNKSNSPGIVNNRFVSLFEAANGDLWAGTEESGVVRLHDGRFTHYAMGEATGEAAGVNWIGDSGADGAVLALVGNEKTMRFAGGEFRPFDGRANSAENVRSVPRQSVRAYCNFRLPVNTFGCYADGRWLDFSPAPGEPEYKLRTAARDAAGNFWLLTESHELVRVENGKTVRVYKTGDGLPGIPLDFVVGAKTSLVSWDGRDSLLLTDLETMRSELLVKTPADLTPTTGDIYPPFTENESPFRSSYQDAEGNLWFGTLRGGLYRARKQVVKTFSTAAGLTDTNVYPIFENDDGSLLIGTTNGLFSFNGNRFAPVASAEKFYVQAIGKDPAGRIVVSELYHLYVRQANGLIPFLVEQFSVGYGVYAVHTDRENRFWSGNEKGLYRFGDGASATETFTTDNGLAGNDVKTIIDAKSGGVWIGTYGGLSLYRDGKITSWTDKDGLPSLTIRALYEDADSTLWIGTYDGGLARFKDGKFTAFNSKIGLYTDEAFQILEDDNRNFWISSNHGIYRVNKDELNEYADGKRQTITSVAYGKSDGMLNAECNGGRSPAGVKTRDGRLWFPTQDGVAMIDPREIKINSQPPPVVIESVKVDDQLSELSASPNNSSRESRALNSNKSLTDVQPSADAGNSNLIINPNQQNFEIGYTALSFINSENLRFKYKLEGLDNDWIDAGTRRLAYFSHVPPGEYTFRVTAANSDGVWNEQGATLKITVKPPFYRTWWFALLAVLAVGMVVFLLYRRRFKKLEKERLAQAEFSRRLINAHETERRRIAAELHDSIGQSLAMIKNSAVFGSKTVGSVTEAKEHLTEISGASAQAISEVREIAYNLRPFMLDRLGLTKAISSLLNKIADNSALKIVSEIENIDGIFESEAEISVYRIIQECLNNIMKHSEASEVNVKIAKSERAVLIKISDDGKGFDAKNHDETNRTGGFGLIGISERVRILGGTMAIDSAVGVGTIVKIEIWRQK